jgi:hypothetical protein
MRRFKIIGLVCMAVCALGVMTASAAFGQSTILPEFSKVTTGSGTSGKGSLLLEGATISCESGTSKLSATSTKLGTFAIVFSGCKSVSKPCRSLGQAAGSGTIETTGEYHLVSLLTERKHYEVWFLLAATDSTAALHLECEAAAVGLVLVWGNFLGLIEEKSNRTFKLNVEREGEGASVKQKITGFGNNGGTETKAAGLKGKIGTGVEKPAGEESENNLVFMAEEVSIKES